MHATSGGRRQQSARGFTLLEAAVALVVLAFGMLAIAGFQLNLSRGSDAAKQRTEATRLAQEKMEELRSFEQLVADAAKFDYADLIDGADTPATLSSTTYARSWTVSGTAASPHRTISVTVTWADRESPADNVSVNLTSLVSRTDPAAIGSLAVPPADNSALRRPKSRSIHIPIDATRLGGTNTGYSTAQWPSGGWLVFDDVSGGVIATCATAPNDSTNLSLCTAFTPYVLSGFINDGNINGANNFSWTPTDAVLIDTQDVIGTPDCVVQVATDPNKELGDPGYELPDYLVYACLVQPTDHDSSDVTPRRWSGKLNVVPPPAGFLCRFDSNVDNPATGVHENVTGPLDNQNYVAATAACPSGTTQHQPP